ncbi:unnamed protein product [Rotaria sp. Silwood1]|nr:unnamed protein product [Rotaria sp. Silwood1]CAF3375589.1 unnamed protein product [Rotaria sp. Silwood1]CAF4742303.1 unnamed protein product [Rotaria sp. Silwood1]
MLPSSNESDIQFQLYFLGCDSDSITRSSNDTSIVGHVIRSATNKIQKFEKIYNRKESNRVTDIDQLSLFHSPTSFPRKNTTRRVSIEITKNENSKLSIPIVKSVSSTRSPSLIEIKADTKVSIPQAPPLPNSFDLAIKLQSKSFKTAIISPDQETLWSKAENYDVAGYFNPLIKTINEKNSNTMNESKIKTILDNRKSYNLGLYDFSKLVNIFFRILPNYQ